MIDSIFLFIPNSRPENELWLHGRGSNMMIKLSDKVLMCPLNLQLRQLY